MTSLSFTKHIFFAFCLLLATQLAHSQNVTVAGAHASSNGSYATLKAAFDAINAQSQTGNTITVTISASTTETAAAVLNAGAWTALTVKPAAAATPTVSGSISSAIIKLDGADNVTIDGSNAGGTDRSLTISNASSGNSSSTIWLASLGVGAGATNNTIKNCNVAAGSNTVTTFAITAGSADNDNLTIQNNAITKAYYGIYVVGTTSGVSDNLMILQNSIGSGTAANYVTFKGVYLGNVTGCTVSQNTIFNLITTVANPFGIHIDNGVTNSTIARNEIRSVHYTGSGSSGGKGIHINTGSSSSNLTIANNMISDIRGDGASSMTGGAIVGIRILAGTGGITLQYNSVNLGSGSFAGNASGTVSAALYVGSTSTSVTLQNNIFSTNLVNTNAAGAKTYAIYVEAWYTAFTNIDYNDYYATGSQAVLGYHLGSDITTLALWKVVINQDEHSLDVNPPFTSATDLHLNTGTATQLESGGTTVSVTNDFDGNTRNNPPDIGGDECACTGSMNYASSTTTQTNTSSVNHNTTNNQVIGIQIVTINANNPINATSFTISTTGTTSTTDIANAKLWYTGTSSTFATTTQFGSTVAAPGGSFNITGTQALAQGTNYFWLTYDVVAGAVEGNVIDAQCTSLTVGGNTHPPTVTSPAGSRTIVGPMSGTYTVGTGGTYPTLKAAADEMNVRGLKGNVTLSILASGTTETAAASFNQWTEYSGSNYTLTIKPAAGTTPIISGNISTAVIKLNGADRVTIDGSNSGGTDRSLTISNTNTADLSTVIWIGSLGTGAGATGNTIKNCNVAAGSNILSTFGIVASGSGNPFANGADNDNLTIQNNAVTKAGYGIFVAGDAPGVNDNLLITQNSIGSNSAASYVSLNGMFLGNATGCTISQNTIFNIISAELNPIGMFVVDGFVNSTISRNEIRSVHYTGSDGSGGKGIYVNTGSASSNLTIANNMISDIRGDGAGNLEISRIVGIFIEGSTGGVTLQYNSVNLGSGSFAGNASGTVSAALFVGSASTSITLQNNIFSTNLVNTNAPGAKTYAIYVEAWYTAFTNIDYNDYYATGSQGVLGFLTSDRTTLAAWKTATSQDDHSLDVNPPFTSATDLHLNSGTATQLESGGTPVSITNDFDGNTRNNPPDIGGDECACTGSMNYASSTTTQTNTSTVYHNTTHNEVIGIQIVTVNANNPINATSFTVNTTGTTSTADIANAKLWYTGTSGTFATTTQFGSTVAAPNGSFNITGTQALAQGTNYFWLTYDVVAGANNGNVIDAQCTSLTVGGNTHPPTVTAPAGSRTIAGPLSGTYTVGTGGAFSTLKAAADHANAAGLKGNVTLSILASGTTETAMASFNQWTEYNGSNYTLTIKPAAGTSPTISGDLPEAVIKLNGADRVTIDGSNSGGTDRSLTIRNTSTTSDYSGAIWLASLGAGAGAANNTIKNCNVAAGSNTAYYNYGIGAFGSIFGGSVGADNDNLTIQNNAVTKAYIGIFIVGDNPGLNDNLMIVQNSIGSNSAADYVSYTGLSLNQATGATISQNTIFNISGSTYQPVGIEIGFGVTNSVVSRNEIRNVIFTGNFGSGGTGIRISTGSASNLSVVNNMISDIGGDGATSVWSGIHGIHIAGFSGGVTLQYNSVNLGSGSFAGNTNGSESAALFVEDLPISLTIQNNIFATNLVNTNAAGSKTYAIYSAAPATAFTVLDNNNYYVSGAQGVLGYLGGDRPSLSQWKAACGKDVYSFNANPPFTSATDLHLNTGTPTPLESGGTAVAVTNDFDGNTRNNPPDIGADECACTPAASMIFSSCTVAQNNTFIVTQNTTHNDVIDIQIVTTNPGAPLSATSFTVNTTGTTSTADIANAKLWFTGTSAAFATNIQFGSTQAAPGGTFTFTGSVVLAEGTNHFWLTYDVVAGAVEGNVIDAQCTSLVVGGNTQVPSITAPAGSRTILGPMSGTYTVGTGGTYPRLKSAADEMNVRGLKGNVTLSILAGGTTETATASFNQWTEYNGSNYTLTIKPAAGATPTISGSISTALIKLNGADRVTIDGSNSGGTDRSMTLSNTDTSTRTAVVWLASLGTGAGAVNNTIKNCNIAAGSNTSTTYGILAAGTSINSAPSGADNDNLTIQNNAVTKARQGIYARGTTAGVTDNLTITQNSIGSNDPANYVTGIGMDVAWASGATISQNTIFNILNNLFGPTGINVFSGFVNSTISRNEIRSIRHTGNQGKGAIGMNIGTFNTASNVTISNNVVSDIGADLQSNLISISGIQIIGNSTGGITVQYNSVNLGSGSFAGSASGFYSAAFYVGAGTGTGFIVQNNIFATNLVNTNNADARTYAIYSSRPASAFSDINYNDYYASGTQGVLGYLGGDRTTLSAWKTATGKDASSVTGDPGFTAPTNLFIDNTNPNCWNVNGKAKQLSISEDFGSAAASRSTAVANGAPDIGADEFSVNPGSTPPTPFCFTPVVGANAVVFGGRTIATLTFGAGGVLPTQVCASYFTDVTPPDANNGGQSGIGSANFMKGYLQLDATGGSGYTYDMVFQYDEVLLGMVGEAEPQFDLAQRQTLFDGTWIDLGATANTTTNQLTATGLTSLSVFAVTNADLNVNQNNWTGAVSTDWFTAGNWSAGVPTATSAAIIPNVANDPVIGAAGAVAKSVVLASGASLNISAAGTLALDGSGAQAFWNQGTVLNSGSINIGAATSAGTYGLLNDGTFSNNTGAQITINRATLAGIQLQSGSFFHSGTLTIGNLQPMTNLMSANNGTFFNNTGGILNGTSNLPAASFFNNGGTLSPGYSAGTMTFNAAEDFNASILSMEISETAGVVSKDLVAVSGNAALTGGTLNVVAGGTVPGGSHQLLSFTGNPGSTQFTTVNLPALCGGCSLVYSATGVSLNNTMACFPNLTLNNLMLATGTYRSQGDLTSGNSTVGNGKTVEFKSDTGVLLQAGFEVQLGGVFEAVISACQ